MSIDFIPEMTKHLMAHYPLHETWANLLSAATMSSALTNDTYFLDNRGPNSCNLWIGYFAPSGDYKTTPIQNVTTPLLSILQAKHDRCIILPSVASTIEGLIKYFKRFPENRDGVILKDELTMLFKEVGKSYMTEEMELYSKTYDGELMPRSTMKFLSKDIMRVYVNLIGATTPRYLYAVMTEKFFFQGCGNRFLYVKNKLPVQNKDTVNTLFNKTPKHDIEGIPAELEPFYNFLETITEAPYTILMGDQNALEMSVKFHNDRETAKDNIKETDENAFKKEYISRDWQKSLKLAQLHAISRKAYSKSSLKTQPDGKRLVEMECEDIEWGQKIVKDCFGHFESIVTEWKANIPTESQKVVTDTVLANRYLDRIKEYGVISQAKLAKEVGCIQRTDIFYNVLGYLINVGCVEQMPDCPEFIRKQGEQWMKEQMINPNFKTPPKLYKYIQSLE